MVRAVSSALPRIASRREASPLRDPRAFRENFCEKRVAILSTVHSFLCQAKVAVHDAGIKGGERGSSRRVKILRAQAAPRAPRWSDNFGCDRFPSAHS